MKHHARQCTARCKDGRPCRSWAVHDSHATLCASHHKSRLREARHNASKQPPQTGAGPLGFYEGAYTLAEAAGHIPTAQAKNLEAELTVTRLAVRYVLLRLQQEPDSAEFIRLIKLIFQGTRTIAAIMRVQHTLPSAEDIRHKQSINAALDELSAEWGLDL